VENDTQDDETNGGLKVSKARIPRIALLLVVPLLTTAGWAVEIIEGPTLTMDPNGVTPLAGVVELKTDSPVRVTLKISNGGDSWKVKFPEARRDHALPLLGLEPDSAYEVELHLSPGGPVRGSLSAFTGPLPQDFPAIEVGASDPKKMEPGFTLLDCFFRQNGDSRPEYTMIVDDRGDVVWYSTRCSSAMRQLPNGNLWFRDGASVFELDMIGNQTLVTELADPGLGLHHDIVRSPLGTYISLSTEVVMVPDYPTSEADPNAPTQTAPVVDEPVVLFAPDGSLLGKWRLTEMLDPTRIGYGSLTPTESGAWDWGHANAVVYDPRDDSILVSVRHQDAVVKFSRATGELIWILAPHDNWSPEFEPFLLQPVGRHFEWQYHQHAPMITPSGTLLLFDNGNRRASPFDGNDLTPDAENVSRAVEYSIDEEAMEVEQVWQYGPGLFSPFISDVDWLPRSGNVLVTFGATSYVGGVRSIDLGRGTIHTRIIEVDHRTSPREVFDLTVYDRDGGMIAVYRSERIPSLYGAEVVTSK
jgi:arylsulfate sulfotransferase